MEETILVVGDAHVTDGQDLSRFDLLGKMIVDRQPDHVVFIGDFLTLQSLSAWDRDKRQRMENERYGLEIDAGNLALDKCLSPLYQIQDQQRSWKVKQYRPNLVFVMGNHEDRLRRYLEHDPTFEGFVSIEKDLSLYERGFTVVPFREYYYINGIGFTHIPHNKASAITSTSSPTTIGNIIGKAATCTVRSVVFGHTHEQYLGHMHKEGMEHLQDIYNCGCFFTEHEDYVHGMVTMYWKGLSLLTTWEENRFDVESFSMSRLEQMYG